MSTILKKQILSIFEEIEMHPAWYGSISGLSGEKMLRGKTTPYLYILRKGELENDYYITFISSDLTIRHQPFLITDSIFGWHYENGCIGGPLRLEVNRFDDIIHQIMHCQKGECVAFTSNA